MPSRGARSSRLRDLETETHVRCRLCQRWFQAITYTHLLYRHHIDEPSIYKADFGLDKITAFEVRMKVAEAKRALRAKDLLQIRRDWGSIPQKEIAAGLKVNVLTIRNHAKRMGLPLLVRSWNRRSILQALRKARRVGLPLHSGAIRVHSHALYSAARKHFGSLGRALNAAGIAYAAVRRRQPFERWTSERILREIAVLARNGKHTDYRYLERRQSKLYAAARNHFGNWHGALLAYRHIALLRAQAAMEVR